MKYLIFIKLILINLKNSFFRKKHRIRIFQDSFNVTDINNDTIFIARLNRHNRYKNGIKYGVDLLAKEYFLDKINFPENAILIDCGANVGELAFWSKKNKVKYIGIEPERLEFECLVKNANKDSLLYNCALWNKREVLKMFSLPESGDTSVFEFNNFSSHFCVQGERLDQIIDITGDFVVLKVEGEGAEPEILDGALSKLSLINYVTVDCGFERGKDQTHTFVEVNKILVDHGFELIESNLHRVTMLYQKKS